MTLAEDQTVVSPYTGYRLSRTYHAGQPVIRKSFPHGSHDRWRTEAAAYRLLRETTRVVTPELVAVHEDADGYHLLIAHSNGSDLDVSSLTDWFRVGEAVRACHSAHALPPGHPYGDVAQPSVHQDPAEYWESRLRDLRKLAVVDGEQLDRLRDQWRQLARLPATVTTEATVVHRDLRPPNILVSDQAVHIIDWEIAVICHPAFDLVRLELAVPDPAAGRALYDGYGRCFDERVVSYCRRMVGAEFVLAAESNRTSELWRQGLELLCPAPV